MTRIGIPVERKDGLSSQEKTVDETHPEKGNGINPKTYKPAPETFEKHAEHEPITETPPEPTV